MRRFSVRSRAWSGHDPRGRLPQTRATKPAERAEPNLLSLAIFVAGLFGVLLIPLNYKKGTGPDDE